jgi:hypothetical protein
MVATRRCPFITAIGTLMPLAVSAQELEEIRISSQPALLGSAPFRPGR